MVSLQMQSIISNSTDLLMKNNLHTECESLPSSARPTAIGSRHSSVGITTGYGLHDRGSIPGRTKKFSLLDGVQTDPESPPTFYPLATGGSTPRFKADWA
jgi:hypothetical protein